MSSLLKPPPIDAWVMRIAEALERLAPPPPPAPYIAAADAFVWHIANDNLTYEAPPYNRQR